MSATNTIFLKMKFIIEKRITSILILAYYISYHLNEFPHLSAVSFSYRIYIVYYIILQAIQSECYLVKEKSNSQFNLFL